MKETLCLSNWSSTSSVLDHPSSETEYTRRSISYDLHPSPCCDYTVQSLKFAIEAKNYVRLRWNPAAQRNNNNHSPTDCKNNWMSHYRKVVKCFPFLTAFKQKKDQKKKSIDVASAEIVLHELIGESLILRPMTIQLIGQELPARSVGFPWTLRFCTSRDGFSLHNLYRKLNKTISPVLLVIEDLQGRIFGGLSSSTLKISDNFYGTSECFLFTCFPEFKVFKWNGDNFYFVEAHEDYLAFGSGFGRAGLWLDSDLNKGRTDSCITYGNPPLIPECDFIIKNLECWTFS